jgi:hypothetical protein
MSRSPKIDHILQGHSGIDLVEAEIILLHCGKETCCVLHFAIHVLRHCGIMD